MSIIGTRPPLISETNLYELHHRARLAIKPGITGMWQVSGRSDITDFEEVVRLDKEYIENWNIGMDSHIDTMSAFPLHAAKKSLYKIYIYGSRKGIRSSRKLAESCKVNLEVKWMIGGVEPDFRTIADFRKNNIGSLN